MRNLGTREPLPVFSRTPGDWLLLEEGFVAEREHELESIFAVGNGYLGIRGAFPTPVALSTPSTLLAGLYVTPNVQGAVPELADIPTWNQVSIFADGEAVRAESGRILSLTRGLNLQHGWFGWDWRHETPRGRIIRVRGVRLASMADKNLAIMHLVIETENFGGKIGLEAPLQLPAATQDVWNGQSGTDYGWEAIFGVHTMALDCADEFTSHQGIHISGSRQRTGAGWQASWETQVQPGQSVQWVRYAALCDSRKNRQPKRRVQECIRRTTEGGAAGALQAHAQAWDALWRASDIAIEGDELAQRAARFAVYHLTSAEDADEHGSSIGARALTGHGYKGHVFWDTEIFMLPFFIFTQPQTAKSLLLYRHRTLPAARERASDLGYKGALYAWESADTGADVTPRYAVAPDGTVVEILSGLQEHHISAAVAYGVWQYWSVTGDDEFMREAGVEILVETARFWASRAQTANDGFYHITGVMGPDEYHPGVNDNAFTNIMAQANLERAAVSVTWAGRLGRQTWGVTPDELEQWKKVAGAMYIPFHLESGLIEQFAGYFDRREPAVPAGDRERLGPADVLLGFDELQQSKLIKQADVAMIFALFPERYSADIAEKNYDYYEPLTAHGSSLCPPVLSWVAAQTGRIGIAKRYFRQTAEIDLANNMGNAAGGVHAAALGGLWQSIVMGFAGMRLRLHRLAFAPRLPADWRGLRFQICWRGHGLRVAISGNGSLCEFAWEGGAPLSLDLGSRPLRLEPGRAQRYQKTAGAAQLEWEPAP